MTSSATAERPAKSRTLGQAGLWAGSGRLIGRVLDVTALIVLAQLLTPSDFGVVAMAMTVILLIESATQIPLNQPILRASEPSQAHYDTAFTLGVVRAILIGLIVAATSPLVADYYREDRLVLLVGFLAAAPMLRGLLSPRLADRVRGYDLRPEFLMVVGGKLVALAAVVVVATTTRSYWAIAAGTVATPIVMCVVSYLAAPYRPRLSLAAWPDFADVVGWNSLNQVFASLNFQLDRIVLGRLISPADLGRYALAADVAALPIQALVQPMEQPMLAAFAKARDTGATDRLWLLGLNGLLALLGPAFLAFSILAGPMVHFVLGPGWLDMAAYLTPIALVGFLTVANWMLAPLAVALYRADLPTKRTMLSFSLRLPLIVAGGLAAGPLGAIAARGAAGAAETMFSLRAAKQLTGVRVATQVWSLRRTVVGLGAFALTILSTAPEVPPSALAGGERFTLGARLLLSVLAGASAMIAATFTLWRVEQRPAGLEARVVTIAASAVARWRIRNGGGS